MEKSSNIKRYTADDLCAMRAQGESKTDFVALDGKTEEQLERDIASDPDFADQPADWYISAAAVTPKQKTMLTLRLDEEVVQWFRAGGPGYQTRMNAVLKAFIMHQKQAARKRA